MNTEHAIELGQIVIGPQFNEPMRVETVQSNGNDTWVLGLVGVQSERFRRVTITSQQLSSLTVLQYTKSFDGDGALLRLGLQAYSLGIAYEFDPYFGLSISRVDPLPHQLEAVYDYLLKLARVRFLLADDAGAGKTIMAGLLIRELKLRGLAERILIVCPANLTFQWQRELKEKFDEKFIVLKGGEIREQFGINQWLEQRQVMTSLDLAKREEILPGLSASPLGSGHRGRGAPHVLDATHKSPLHPGELLRDSTDHFSCSRHAAQRRSGEFQPVPATARHDAYADVKSIREAMSRNGTVLPRAPRRRWSISPSGRPTDSWVAHKIFTKRIPHTVDFHDRRGGVRPLSGRHPLREGPERTRPPPRATTLAPARSVS